MRAEVHAVFRFGASVVHVAIAPIVAIRRRGTRAIGAPNLPQLPHGLVAVDGQGRVTVLGEPLALGGRRVVDVAPLEVEISFEDRAPAATPAGIETAAGAPRPWLSNAASIALHGALLAALALFAPPPDDLDLRADRQEMQARLDARFALGVADEDAIGASARGRDEAVERDATRPAPRTQGAAGPASVAPSAGFDRATSRAARAPARATDGIADARSFGMIALLDGVRPSAPLGDVGLAAPPDAAFLGGGDDPWAADLGGAGGLGLSGVGEGGGGRAEGVGLGSLGATLGPLGQPLDDADERGIGVSRGEGSLGGPGRHIFRVRRCACGSLVSGRLPPEAVQRVVRQHFGAFRGCWAQNQLEQASVGGRVTVAFVIGADGSVSSSSVVDASPGLPDGTRSCVARVFGGLSFTPPEGGIVRVTYPIVFEP